MSGEWCCVTKDDKKRVMRRRGAAKSRPREAHSDEVADRLLEMKLENSLSFDVEDKKRFVELLSRCKQELEQLSVPKLVKEAAPIDDSSVGANICLVCYGIGNFSKTSTLYYSASMYQLALALSIREAWDIHESYFLDPCINSIEAEILKDHQFQILENRQGRQRFLEGTEAKRVIIFFMPHCPKRLYENVICAHYDALSRVFILGNSLRNYGDALGGAAASPPSSVEESGDLELSCFEVLYPSIKENPLTMEKKVIKEAQGNLEGALNDTFWTTFDVCGDLPPHVFRVESTEDSELL
jgi:SRR1